MTYQAIITPIVQTRPIDKCDNIQLGITREGNQIIISKDISVGDVGVYFDTDGQLEYSFMKANGLLKTDGGYFEDSGRVRSMKMRGVISEGLWLKLSALDYIGKGIPLPIGSEFDTFNGVKICQKYVNPATKRQREGSNGTNGGNIRANKFMKRHIETGQWSREYHTIPSNSFIYISEKLHGTSFRVGRVLDTTNISYSWFGRLLAKLLGWPKTKTDYTVIHGSRNILFGDDREGWRQDALRCVQENLKEGEIIFGELVGYEGPNARPIMGTHDMSKLHKTLRGGFGDRMVFAYGVKPEEGAKPFVYRIVQNGIELTDSQMRKRCTELGISPVPLLTYHVLDGVNCLCSDTVVKAFTEGLEGVPHKSMLDENTIREGIVIRWESLDGHCGWLKNKSRAFGILEGYIKDDINYVDAEESA